LIHPILLLLLFLAAAAPLLLELAARAFFRYFAGFAVGRPWSHERLHPLPGISPALSPAVSFQCNSLGDRAAEPPKANASIYRVLVVGASVAECSMLDQSQSWPSLLEGHLSETLSSSQGPLGSAYVANLARSSLDSFAVRRIVEQRLSPASGPDLLLYAFSYSDVLRWLANFMPADPHTLDVPDSMIFAMHPGRRFAWSPRGSALYFLILILRSRLTGRVEDLPQAGRYMLKCRAWRARGHRVSGLTLPSALVDRAAANLQAIREDCRGAGTRLVVVISPLQDRPFPPEDDALLWLGRIGDGPSEDPNDWRFVPTPELFALLTGMNREVELICARLSIECISLTGAIPPDFNHFYDEAHMTPKGSALMARLLARSLDVSPRRPS
jgi:hypothetical protein